MIAVQDIINKLDGDRKTRLFVLSAVAVLPLIIFSIIYVSGNDMGTLFSGLSEEDISKISMSLEENNISYEVDLESSSILVKKELVHDVRMKLMSNGVVLDSNVGFEIFNDSEFGMTEFSQKINYQRALQGELARTITSLVEVKYARVHIAQSSNKLFKSAKEKSTASIILFIHRGMKLSPNKIRGIQNIVASSVVDLSVDDVIVTNQSGVVLSVRNTDETKMDTLKLSKREQLEEYYRKKVNAILKNSLKTNDYVVSVNVELDYTKLLITKENYIGEPENSLVARERVSESKKSNNTTKNVDNTRTKDVEYKLGKQIENIEPEAGRIKRISIGVLVPDFISESQIVKLKEVIQMALGVNYDRGDNIAIFADDFSKNKTHQDETFIIPSDNSEISTDITKSNIVKPQTKNEPFTLISEKVGINQMTILMITASALALLIFTTLFMIFKQFNGNRKLSNNEREKLLNDISDWFSKDNYDAGK